MLAATIFSTGCLGRQRLRNRRDALTSGPRRCRPGRGSSHPPKRLRPLQRPGDVRDRVRRRQGPDPRQHLGRHPHARPAHRRDPPRSRFSGDADLSNFDQALGIGGSGATALLSHSVKAGLRLGINGSPEPVTNSVMSLGEDGAVATVTFFAVQNPELAAVIAALLLILGLATIYFLWSRIRRFLRRRLEPQNSGNSSAAAPPGT